MKSKCFTKQNGCGRSPPSRGAWIEIAVLYFYCWFRIVAPLAGGVD